MRLAHVSDIHFGHIEHDDIVAALLADVNAWNPDHVAISGDLTQRARPKQYADAMAMLEAFNAPTLVIPGNHDVYAWWHNPWERVFKPTACYCRSVSPDLLPHVETPNLAMLGINSAFGLTIKGGYIRRQTLAHVGAFFRKQPMAAFKVLVVHHHLKKIPDLMPHDVAIRGPQLLALAQEVGVDLVLCGHLHMSHIEHVAGADKPLYIACAGSATSDRGRRHHANRNFYFRFTIEADEVHVEERTFSTAARQFEPARTWSWARRSDVSSAG